MELRDYLNSINKTKVNLMRESGDPSSVSDYPAFVVRRLLSYHMDAIFFVNEMNMRDVDPIMEYEFYLNVLPKKNRFAKLEKAIVPENIELIKKFYNYSNEKAIEVLDLHTENDLEMMRRRTSEGGIKPKNRA